METEVMVVQCKQCKKRYTPAAGKKDYFFATHDSCHNGKCWDCLTPKEKELVRAMLKRPTYSE